MVTGIHKSSTFVPEIEQERSGISRTYKLFVTGPDTVSPFHLRSFSVRSPFYSRSISVLLSFDLRSSFVLPPFFLRFRTENNGKQTENKRRANDSEAKKKRISSELAANKRRICGNFTTCIFLLRLSVFYYTNCIKSSNFAADFVF